MKRFISAMMLFAAAAMAFVSCQKQEMEGAEMLQVSGLTFTSEKPAFDDDTKTEWTGETIQWSKGDAIRVAYTCDGVWQNADGTATADEANGEKSAKIYASSAHGAASAVAQFNVPGSFKGTAEGNYEFYGVYPSSAVGSADLKFAPSVTVNIPAAQTPLAASFDPKADLMAAQSATAYTGIPTEDPISLEWTRIVAHGNITLKGLKAEEGEVISTITLTANAEADMVGSHYLYLDTYNVTKPSGNNAPNVLTLDASNLTLNDGNVEFWACFLPCTWTSLTVVVETDKATYTREITGISKTFKQNARNILSINMATAERVANAAAELPFVRDFSDKTGTGGITELDGFRVNGSVYNAAGAIRLAKGDGEGSITTQLLDISQDFQVRVTAKGWDSDELTLNVSAGDQSEDITLIAEDFVTYAVNFNAVSAASGVTFTAASGKRCYISKIEILAGHDELPPVLRATAPSLMAATGGEASFTYTLTNPKDGQEITAESNVAWISNIVLGEGTVTYSVAENTTEEAREGMITLSYEGIDDVAVTISQAAAAGEGGGESSGGYILVNSLSDITTGQYVVAAKVGDNYYAMSNTFASKINGTEISVNGATISESAATGYVVTITKSGSKYTIHSGTSYLKYGSGTNLAKTNDSYDWTISTGTLGSFRVESSTSGRGLIFRASTYNQFGGYATSNVKDTGAEYYDVELFKLN